MEMNHVVFIVMDSCRYDTLLAARTPNIDRLGKVEKRFSYASWTAPSHYTFTMGLLPHANPKGVLASEVYKDEFQQWVTRTGVTGIAFKDFLPEMSLPRVLSRLGYATIAKVSMPVLNKHTLISKYFDDYKLMDNHNNFAGMVEEIDFPSDQPQYYFLNLGETHYPYMLTDKDLPHISGVHGALKAMGVTSPGGPVQVREKLDLERLRNLRGQQVNCAEYIDGLIGKLMDKAPANTHFIVTADHGELFGEDGFFGHGPIMHEKCFEVPFVEGRLP